MLQSENELLDAFCTITKWPNRGVSLRMEEDPPATVMARTFKGQEQDVTRRVTFCHFRQAHKVYGFYSVAFVCIQENKDQYHCLSVSLLLANWSSPCLDVQRYIFQAPVFLPAYRKGCSPAGQPQSTERNKHSWWYGTKQPGNVCIDMYLHRE